MSKEVRVTIRIPEYLKEKVDNISKELNISSNDVIKIMIAFFKFSK